MYMFIHDSSYEILANIRLPLVAENAGCQNATKGSNDYPLRLSIGESWAHKKQEANKTAAKME